MSTNGKTRTKRTPKKRRNWKPAWLKAYEKTGMVSAACEATKVGRSTVYDARQSDEAFALAWYDIEQASTDELEGEAVRRALDSSDTLLIFLLKSRKPDIYREQHRIHGKLEHEHTHEIANLDDAIDEVVDRLASARET